MARMRVAPALTARLVPDTSTVGGAGSPTSLRVRAASESLTPLLDMLIETVRAGVELFA